MNFQMSQILNEKKIFWNQSRFNWTERKLNILNFLFLPIKSALVIRHLFTSYVIGTDSFMLKTVLLLFDSLKQQIFYSNFILQLITFWDKIRKHWSSLEQSLSFDAFDGFLELIVFLLDQKHELQKISLDFQCSVRP